MLPEWIDIPALIGGAIGETVQNFVSVADRF